MADMAGVTGAWGGGWACALCGTWVVSGSTHQCGSTTIPLQLHSTGWPVNMDRLVLEELQAIKALLQKLVDR